LFLRNDDAKTGQVGGVAEDVVVELVVVQVEAVVVGVVVETGPS
jgi:hypothetical protein